MAMGGGGFRGAPQHDAEGTAQRTLSGRRGRPGANSSFWHCPASWRRAGGKRRSPTVYRTGSTPSGPVGYHGARPLGGPPPPERPAGRPGRRQDGLQVVWRPAGRPGRRLGVQMASRWRPEASGAPKGETPIIAACAVRTGVSLVSGRLDLNQRPLAPQVRPHDQSSDAESRKVSQSDGFPLEAFSMPSPDSAEFRRSFNAPVMQGNVTAGADTLLTVKEAAERLKVSTATVYALCASGRLAHLRISTHAIRIAGEDLGRFVRACVGHR